jgi:hypothetical protein
VGSVGAEANKRSVVSLGTIRTDRDDLLRHTCRLLTTRFFSSSNCSSSFRDSRSTSSVSRYARSISQKKRCALSISVCSDSFRISSCVGMYRGTLGAVSRRCFCKDATSDHQATKTILTPAAAPYLTKLRRLLEHLPFLQCLLRELLGGGTKVAGDCHLAGDAVGCSSGGQLSSKQRRATCVERSDKAGAPCPPARFALAAAGDVPWSIETRLRLVPLCFFRV